MADLSRAAQIQAAKEAALSRREERMDQLAALEDEIYVKAAEVVYASMEFAAIDPSKYAVSAEDTPEEAHAKSAALEQEAIRLWPELSADDRMRRMRILQAGWLPTSMAPNGVKVSQNVHAAITRARGMQGRVNKQMNVTVNNVRLPAPTSKEHPELGEQYEIVDVE